jgi:hypothetical protein
VNGDVSVPNGGQVHAILEEFGFTGQVNRFRMKLGEAPGAKSLRIYGTTPYRAT